MDTNFIFYFFAVIIICFFIAYFIEAEKKMQNNEKNSQELKKLNEYSHIGYVLYDDFLQWIDKIMSHFVGNRTTHYVEAGAIAILIARTFKSELTQLYDDREVIKYQEVIELDKNFNSILHSLLIGKIEVKNDEDSLVATRAEAISICTNELKILIANYKVEWQFKKTLELLTAILSEVDLLRSKLQGMNVCVD